MKCSYCGREELLPFRCKFCKRAFCAEHRLPENHECEGLEAYKNSLEDDDKRIEIKKIIYTPDKVRREIEIIESPLSSFRIPSNLYITEKIIGICVLMFAMQILIPQVTFLFQLKPSRIFETPWTLITHMFLHGSFMHLLFNMWVLYLFGNRLERKIGSKNFLYLYMLSGLTGGIGYTLLSATDIPAVGASGAIYGVFGCLAILEPELIVYVQFFIPMKLIHAALLFAFIDFASLGANDMIGHAAHLSGMAIGFYIGKKLKNSARTIETVFI